MSHRTRYGCRKLDRDDGKPLTVPLGCPRCDELFRTTIAELMQFAKEEYARGLRESANVLHAHADRVLKSTNHKGG